MEIKTRQRGDILVVDVVGRLDTSTSGAAHDEMTAIANDGAKRVLLNLDKLEYISSAGLRAILTLAKLLQSSRGEMKVCNASAAVKEVLAASGFHSLIKIFDREQSAIESWSRA